MRMKNVLICIAIVLLFITFGVIGGLERDSMTMCHAIGWLCVLIPGMLASVLLAKRM